MQNIKKIKNMETLKSIEFIQLNENTPAEFVLIHIPDKDVFISNWHPSSALYEDVTMKM